jgi:hypothetical protein
LIHGNIILENIEFNNKYYNFNCFIIDENIFGIVITDITYINDIQNLKNVKNNFLISIINKIKNPINRILSNLNLLIETNINIEQRQFINSANDCCFYLSTIIDDFHDYINLKLNNIKLVKEIFNLKEEIDKYYDNIILKAKEKNIEINFDIDNSVPNYINLDKYRFKQILFNLLSNALKFTEKGKINLKIYCEHIFENKYNMQIEISDTGIGINNNDIDKIFQSFYQISNNKTNNKFGSGLGLSICYHLCNLFEGKIWVKSELDKGSTFYLSIPIEESEEYEDNIKKKSFELFIDKKILIVDDD